MKLVNKLMAVSLVSILFSLLQGCALTNPDGSCRNYEPACGPSKCYYTKDGCKQCSCYDQNKASAFDRPE